MKEKLYSLFQDSLFRNSFYLMLATGVMAGFGFFFWLISARLFSTEDIGLATTLISVMNIIALLSLIGFDSAFVRFLPNSDKRNDHLNTGLILVGATALVLAFLFIVFVPEISPRISFIGENLPIALAFIFFCVMSALNILTDSVFLADRQTKFTLIINTAFSVLKMVLPFAFIGWGALGVFTAAAIAQTVGFVLSIVVMMRKFDYRPQFIISNNILKLVRQYCLGNYIAVILNLLPIALLPIIITNNLGPEQAAYYYIVMMIANLLYVIPQATTKSLFAEGSNNEGTLRTNVGKSVRNISILLIPAIAVLILGGKYILGIFGEDYSTGGLTLLYFIAIAAIPVSGYSIFYALLRIKKGLNGLIITNIFYAGSIIGLSYALLPMGLVGIGIAWLFGNVVASVVSCLMTTQGKR
ncbi:MAG: oligosaccharide flippase family protein [Patescibacteria group bacterium]